MIYKAFLYLRWPLLILLNEYITSTDDLDDSELVNFPYIIENIFN